MSDFEVYNPKLVTVPVIGNKAKAVAEALACELVVFTEVAAQRLPKLLHWLDESLCGQIQAALKAHDFSGRLGSSVLIPIEHGCLKRTEVKVRHVLVVGIGDFKDFHARTLCGLMDVIGRTAYDVDAHTICLSVGPNRLTSGTISLRGTGAIMRCRVATTPYCAHVAEIRILCSPQAQRFLDEGFDMLPPRCATCVNPTIAQKENQS
jgi:hypothetical protein